MAVATAVAAVAGMCPQVTAQVSVFDGDEEGWLDAAGEFATTDFTGFGEFTVITDQYIDEDVLFTDGNDFISFYDTFSFPNDGWGLRSSPTPVCLEFATPRQWIAVEFPGIIQLRLFQGGELIFSSPWLGGSGLGHFAGLISNVPFDSATIRDPLDSGIIAVNVDDIHFGPPRWEGDVDGDGAVGIPDLFGVVANWGACPDAGFCIADVNHDAVVDVEDLIEVLMNWNE